MALIVAHRASNSKGYEENSIDAIICAKKDNPDGAIEIDLAMTKDNVVVVTHNYMIDGKRVKDSYYNEIKRKVYALPDIMEKVDGLFYFEIKRYTNWKAIIEYLHDNKLLTKKMNNPLIESDSTKNLANRLLSSKLDALKYAKNIDNEIYCNYLATDLDPKGNIEKRRILGVNVPVYNMKIRPFPISKRQIAWAYRFNFEEISCHKYLIEWFSKNTEFFRRRINLGIGQINNEKDMKIVDKYNPEIIYTDKPWFIIERLNH